MYKVFINDYPIILTDSKNIENNYPQYSFNNHIIDEVIDGISTEKLQGANLISKNLKEDWKKFQQQFKLVAAAGGFVLNKNNEALFIYRNNKWDLPKGHIEKNETIETAAIREVEEECGIDNLNIICPLPNTYHIYYLDNKRILKCTYWFLMKTAYQGTLTPQIEEGISQVVFKNKEQILDALKNSYENIRFVFEAYNTISNIETLS